MTSLEPVQTSAPGTAIMTATEAKVHFRKDDAADTTEDSLIDVMIAAATDNVEKLTGRKLINQTWQIDFNGFGNCMRLSFAPVGSISSITYYDADNASQTLASTEYVLFEDSAGPFVTLAPLKSWPGTYSRKDAVRITFVTGYGAASTDVPDALLMAAKIMVADLYESRGSISEGMSVSTLPIAASVHDLIAPYVRKWVA